MRLAISDSNRKRILLSVIKLSDGHRNFVYNYFIDLSCWVSNKLFICFDIKKPVECGTFLQQYWLSIIIITETLISWQHLLVICFYFMLHNFESTSWLPGHN